MSVKAANNILDALRAAAGNAGTAVRDSVTNAGNTIRGVADNIGEDVRGIPAALGGAVSDAWQDPAGKNLLLAAGGAIPLAAVGGFTQSSGGIRPGETEEQYRTRILRASLLGAVVGGAAAPLGNLAADTLASANPTLDRAKLGEFRYQDPNAKNFLGDAQRSQLVRLYTGAQAGGAATAAFWGARDGVIKKEISNEAAEAMNVLRNKLQVVTDEAKANEKRVRTLLGQMDPEKPINGDHLFDPKAAPMSYSNFLTGVDAERATINSRLLGVDMKAQDMKNSGIFSFIKRRFRNPSARIGSATQLIGSGVTGAVLSDWLGKNLPTPAQDDWSIWKDLHHHYTGAPRSGGEVTNVRVK